MRLIIPAIFLIASVSLIGQERPAPAFDVVSIKKSDPSARGGSGRTMPDGTTVITNQPIRGIFVRGSSEPVRDIENVPDWAMDFYDITVKPSTGADRSSIPAMWRAMLADRLKFKAHIEHREKNGYALTVARRDGRLGPNLKPSTLDCTPRPQATAPPQPAGLRTRQEASGRCGMLGGQGYIVSGGMDMARLAQLVSGWVQAPVTDRTGLKGYYSLELTYSTTRQPAVSSDTVDPATPPDPLAALGEQLGLKLEGEKMTIPILVIDHIERPSEN